MTTPDITVVIPTRHRNEQLALCLECLAPGVQTLPFERYEVVVTDDGTSSNAEAMIEERFSWVTWVSGPQRGPAANRNNGAGLAQAPWIAFTDDDCLPQANWLEKLVENSTCEEIGAIEGAISATGHAKTQFSECPINEDGGHFWSADIAVRKDVFQTIGGFDEDYPLAAHEDQDLYIRLKERTSITFVREAIVLHPIRDINVLAYLRSRPARARAYAVHLAKHRHDSSVSTLMLEFVVNALRTVVRNTRQRKFKAGFAQMIESLVILTLTPYYFRYFRHKIEA